MPAKLPPLRVDAIDAVKTTLEVMVVLGVIKVLAYRWHGNPISQAILILY
jgi:hypothetical protein